MTDTKELQSILFKKDITLARLSKLIDLSPTTLSYKINNIREFKAGEIKKLQEILELNNVERDKIFFN